MCTILEVYAYRTKKVYKFRKLFFFHREYIFNISLFRVNTICQYTMSNVYQFVSHINTFKNDKIKFFRNKTLTTFRLCERNSLQR